MLIKAPPPAEPPPTPKTVYFEPEKQHHSSPPVDTSTLPEEFQYQWDDTSIPPPNQPSSNAQEIPSVTEEPIIAAALTVTRTGRVIRPPTRFAESAHSTMQSFLSTFSPSI